MWPWLAFTLERYRSHLDIHILPRFGDTPLNAITRMAVKRWIKDLGHKRADATIASILSLLSMILGEAVEERRIPTNPCRRLRNASANHRPERPWATPEQVNQIAARVTAPNRVLIIIRRRRPLRAEVPRLAQRPPVDAHAGGRNYTLCAARA